MPIPSSDAELVDKGAGGDDDNSRGGGDGDDLHDAELLLPGEVPAQETPENREKRLKFLLFIFYFPVNKSEARGCVPSFVSHLHRCTPMNKIYSTKM